MTRIKALLLGLGQPRHCGRLSKRAPSGGAADPTVDIGRLPYRKKFGTLRKGACRAAVWLAAGVPEERFSAALREANFAIPLREEPAGGRHARGRPQMKRHAVSCEVAR